MARQRTHLVFVYGTLLSGFGNNRLLQVPGATLVAKGVRTRPIYTMISLGGFPGVQKTGETSIEGEIYQVTDQVRASLDRLESHPGFYERSYVHLQGEPYRRWHVEAYFLPRDWKHNARDVIRGGSWRALRTTS